MTDDTGRAPATQRGKRERARMIVGAIAIVAAAALVLANTQTVKIHWVVATTRTPLIVALLVAMLLGALLGLLAARQRRRHSARE